MLPARFAIYLCIGTAYGLSVFWLRRTPSSAGGWETYLVLAALYVVCMVAGASAYHGPPAGSQPGSRQRHGRQAFTTSQFWLLWAVLYLNVIAGIGIIGIASSMLQDIFGVSADDAAAFTILISVCSIAGGLAWASLSDRIGRKRTCATLFILGVALYALVPTAAHSGSQTAFVIAVCIIASVHGGGFTIVPAHVADIFGWQSAGAIYARVLTAWPAAAITAPVLMRYIRDTQRLIGFPWPVAYDNTMYILAAILLVALIANAFVRPVAADSGEAP